MCLGSTHTALAVVETIVLLVKVVLVSEASAVIVVDRVVSPFTQHATERKSRTRIVFSNML